MSDGEDHIFMKARIRLRRPLRGRPIWDQNLISKSFPSMSSPVESLQPELILSIFWIFLYKNESVSLILVPLKRYRITKIQNHYENVS